MRLSRAASSPRPLVTVPGCSLTQPQSAGASQVQTSGQAGWTTCAGYFSSLSGRQGRFRPFQRTGRNATASSLQLEKERRGRLRPQKNRGRVTAASCLQTVQRVRGQLVKKITGRHVFPRLTPYLRRGKEVEAVQLLLRRQNGTGWAGRVQAHGSLSVRRSQVALTNCVQVC